MSPDFPARVYDQRFDVAFDYPVYFTRGVFDPANPLLVSVLDRKGGPTPHKVQVYVDTGVAEAQPGLVAKIEAWFGRHAAKAVLPAPPHLLNGGENAKLGWGDVRKIMTTMGDSHMDRQSCIMAVGGGGLLDMVGFACALVHRGLRLVRLPTTVLGQNDAGVGVKNGMNERETKNFIGTFAPPFAVVNDYDFLDTLPPREWTGGIAEAFKVAIIKDADFLDFLCRRAGDLVARDRAAMEELVYRCAVLHLQHIAGSGDPFEFGSSRPLDFGHWTAHRLEALSGFALGHGQAVAIGVALDVCYAAEKGFLPRVDAERILRGMTASGLPVWSPLLLKKDAAGQMEIRHGLEQFREHLGGILTLAMPDGPGRKQEIHELDWAALERCFGVLEAFQREQAKAGGTV
jgi:3-dehydroquinate synthase